MATSEIGISGIEMRSALRSKILQRCFVRPLDTPDAPPWRCIAYSISANGVGVALPFKLQPGTVLTIRAWDLPQACSLEARVVHAREVDFVWLTGCELGERLSDAELQVWVNAPRDWLDGQKR